MSAEGVCSEETPTSGIGGVSKPLSAVGVSDAVQKLTPLHLASYRGNSSLLKFLVTAGCPVNCLDGRGRSALHLGKWVVALGY